MRFEKHGSVWIATGDGWMGRLKDRDASERRLDAVGMYGGMHPAEEGARTLDDVEVACVVLSAFDRGEDAWRWASKGRDASKGLLDVLGQDAVVRVRRSMTDRTVGVSPLALEESGLIGRALTTAREEVTEASLAQGVSEQTAWRRSSAAAEVLALMRSTPGWEHGSSAMDDAELLATAVDAGGARTSVVARTAGRATVGEVRAATRLSCVLTATRLDVAVPRSRPLAASAMGRPMDERAGADAPRTVDGEVYDAFAGLVGHDIAVPGAVTAVAGVALTAEEVAALRLPDGRRVAEAMRVAEDEAATRMGGKTLPVGMRGCPSKKDALNADIGWYMPKARREQ